MINEPLSNICVEILALDEAEEELINNLDVRPCDLQHRFVFLGVESLTLRIHGWRYRAEQVFTEHIDDPGVHRFGYDLPVVGHIV